MSQRKKGHMYGDLEIADFHCPKLDYEIDCGISRSFYVLLLPRDLCEYEELGDEDALGERGHPRGAFYTHGLRVL